MHTGYWMVIGILQHIIRMLPLVTLLMAPTSALRLHSAASSHFTKSSYHMSKMRLTLRMSDNVAGAESKGQRHVMFPITKNVFCHQCLYFEILSGRVSAAVVKAKDGSSSKVEISLAPPKVRHHHSPPIQSIKSIMDYTHDMIYLNIGYS
jgi:hypothetical protein